MERLRKYWRASSAIMRSRKNVDTNLMDTQLKRCLTTFDLTVLGVGNMAGTGVYVLTGSVMTRKAGPAAFLSYILAGIVAFINALCYGELAARIPKAGSAYIFTYVAVGQLVAFIIGWSVILEYVLIIASVARSWSGTIDSMSYGAWSNFSMQYIGRFPSNDHWLGSYPDLLAMGIIFVLGLVLCTGAKMSSVVNTFITFVNMAVLLIISVIMLSMPYHKSGRVDETSPSTMSPSTSTSPSSSPSSLPSSSSAFMPFGFSGVISGASTCFYTYVGFDAVTVSSEEAVDPKRSMPIATAVSVVITTAVAALSSGSLVNFVSDWRDVNIASPFAEAFRARGIHWAIYFVGVGSIFGISASLFTGYYALPRIVYSMALDRLIPKFFCKLLPATQVPVVALAVFGGLGALMAMLFNLETLADFLSIGTLVAYLIVAVNVIILRYSHSTIATASDDDDERHISSGSGGGAGESVAKDMEFATGQQQQEQQPEKLPNGEPKEEFKMAPRPGQLKQSYEFNNKFVQSLNRKGLLTTIGILIFLVSSALFSIVMSSKLPAQQTGATIFLGCVFGVGMLLGMFILSLLEQNSEINTFKVPLMPLIPCLCIALDLVLIINLSGLTWIRFFIWLIIGIIIYFGYTLRHQMRSSTAEETNELIANTIHYNTMRQDE